MPCVMFARPELPGSMSDVLGSIAILQSQYVPTQSISTQELVRITVPLTENKKCILRVMIMAMSYKTTLHNGIEKVYDIISSMPGLFGRTLRYVRKVR